jgi:hypothetical protein
MKKISLLPFSFLVTVLNSFGQIPNPSFETWRSYSGTNILSQPFSGMIPVSWQTTDSIYQYGGAGHSAVQDLVDKCDGNYSIQLTTASALGNIGPGAATNGILNGTSLSSITGGSPTTVRSAKLTGCYKYTPQGGDTAYITAVLFKRNVSSRDTIAFVDMQITGTVPLTSFKSNFTYLSNNNPDSILIILRSSPAIGTNAAKIGSSLIVDSLALSGTAGFIGVNELNSIIDNVLLYPSPSDKELNVNITFNKFQKTYYELMDATGRIVLTGEINGTKQKINVSILSNGIYLFALHDDAGEKLYSTKVTVVH